MRKIALSVLFLFALSISYAQQMATGFVYHDANQNGRKDRSEKGIVNVAVSNGREVVQTDSDGRYSLPVGEDNIIFVIKPSGYQSPLNNYYQYKSHYTHKPKGSPELRYKGADPTGPLPRSIDFPLTPAKESTDFSVLVFGDPQAYTIEEMGYFSKGIVQEAKGAKGVSFGISLGDLVGDDLSLHPPYQQAISEIGLPWHHVMGNHDMNYDVKADSLSDETFERNFGPVNYAFNYGNAHFIVLDNILYPVPRDSKGYWGGFRADQLDFVENNLKFVPKDKLIVLAFHIPLGLLNEESFRTADRERLFDLLKDYPNTLSMSAHTHFQRHSFYGKEQGWQQQKPHHEYNVGTTSGDWYSGLKNEQGIPTSTMRDGTPKGYAILNIQGNTYTFDYKVAGKSADYQLKIIFPAGLKQKELKRYTLYANFFIGKEDDVVEYSLDGKKWKKMEHTVIEDPSYLYDLLKFDNANSLIEDRRPSNAVPSSHIWRTKLPKKMTAGNYTIQVRATDMFGKTHVQSKALKITE